MSPLSKTAIGKRIAQIRNHHQLSQTEFGKSIGVTRTSISNIERGDSLPSLDLLTQIILQYQCSFEQIILGDTGSVTPLNAIAPDVDSSSTSASTQDYIVHLKALLEEKNNTISILQNALNDKQKLIHIYEKTSVMK